MPNADLAAKRVDMVWFWIGLFFLCMIIYIVGYVLLRTSGDGRPWFERLVHPASGGLQEEYGGLSPEEREQIDPRFLIPPEDRVPE